MTPSLQRGLLLYQQNRFELAEPEFRQALVGDPNDYYAHAMLALCLSERKQFKEATQEAQLAVHHGPDADFAHYAMARVFFDRNCYPEALSSILEAIRLDSFSAQYFATLASIHLQEKNWAQALQAAERGLEIDPENVGCTNLRAVALVKLGRKIEAGASIESALAKNPESAFTHANNGWRLLEEGKPEKALEHFREALRLDPENEWAQSGIIHALKARYFIYAIFLRYFFWMSRLKGRAQWGVIMGAWFGSRLLAVASHANPALAPWLLPIRILYAAFVILTWTADPFFNLVLRLNKFGRLALTREKRIASNWFGGSLLVALVCLVLGLVTSLGFFLVGALLFGFLVLPIAATFKCYEGWPRRVMAIYTSGLAVLGVGAMASFATHQKEDFSFSLVSGFLIGVFVSQWVANILMSRRRRY